MYTELFRCFMLSKCFKICSCHNFKSPCLHFFNNTIFILACCVIDCLHNVNNQEKISIQVNVKRLHSVHTLTYSKQPGELTATQFIVTTAVTCDNVLGCLVDNVKKPILRAAFLNN